MKTFLDLVKSRQIDRAYLDKPVEMDKKRIRKILRILILIPRFMQKKYRLNFK